MKPPRIIGIAGHMRAGKDTIAAILEKLEGFQRVGFADPLKDMAIALNPIVGASQLEGGYIRLAQLVADEGWEGAKRNPEVRRVLQQLGTEAGREVLGENIWVNTLEQRLFRGWGTPVGGPYAVADVRFLNETYWVQQRGVLWGVRRDGCDGNGHTSEILVPQILEKAEYVFDNNGTIAELEEQVAKVLGR